MICPNCNNEIDFDSRFCKHCGTEFIDVTQEEEPFVAIEQAPPPTNNEKSRRSKRTLSVQILVSLIVFLILCTVLAVVIIANSDSGISIFTKETVTDAQGETVKSGRGETEMSVMDVDGTVRTITADRSLVTPDAILAEYTEVMNGLKADAPAFTYTRYQNLPTDHQNVGPAASFVLPIIEKYVTSKSASEPVSYGANNAAKLPLPDSSYGCLLTDTSKIKNAYCEILDNGNYKIVITLTDELNPKLLPSGSENSQSAITAIFDPYDAATQITAISELAFSSIDFNYTDCTATLVYDHDSKEVRSVSMTMNIDITAEILSLELKARIVDITEYTDIIY